MQPPDRKAIAARIRGLYVIVDAQAAQGRDLVDLARAILRGGARVIQLRDKIHDKGDVLPIARRIRVLCEEHGALLIINDHADLAVACDAHGLHLGQHDLPIKEARAILHPHQIIGSSNALLEEALESERQGADYAAVGAIFPTTSKETTRPAGLETLRRVKERVSIPVVAIGGIHAGNVAQVVRAGADAVCVIAAVVSAPDPEEAVRQLVAAMGLAGSDI
ncbi:MAG: thiC [Dehalococcoidia bacterium]|nr:thiC [Dehalococcoidia bacterium]